MINTSKPSTSITNIARVFDFETWASITTTWASETRTWAATATVMSNTSRPTTSITNVARPI